jgi:hypothetical protein
MPRYVIKSAQMDNWWEQTVPVIPHPLAWISDPVDTGIRDANGNKIFRAPGPVGFVRR